jgi:CRP/FNR family nitrogen fixation transcriptional regulator
MSITEAFSLSHSPSSPVRLAWPVKPEKGSTAMLSTVVDEDARALQQIGTKARVARNETIFAAGDTAAYAYKVVSGVVRLCKHMSDGRRHISRFAFPGDFFSVVDVEHHSFTAEAVTDVVMMCYPQSRLSALRDERASVNRRFAAILSQKLSDMQQHLTVLGRQSAKERVASFLLYLTEHTGCEEDDVIDAPMSRNDVADYLGLTNETVCRVLSELKRERVIESPNVHQFILRNVDALHALADGEGYLAAA